MYRGKDSGLVRQQGHLSSSKNWHLFMFYCIHTILNNALNTTFYTIGNFLNTLSTKFQAITSSFVYKKISFLDQYSWAFLLNIHLCNFCFIKSLHYFFLINMSILHHRKRMMLPYLPTQEILLIYVLSCHPQ